jgi:hypothetical protein
LWFLETGLVSVMSPNSKHECVGLQLADVKDKPKEFTDLYKSIVKSDDSAKVPTIIGENALPVSSGYMHHDSDASQLQMSMDLRDTTHLPGHTPRTESCHRSFMTAVVLQMVTLNLPRAWWWWTIWTPSMARRIP